MKRVEATATINFVSEYSQSRFITEKKGPNETHESFEDRIWKKRMAVNDDGEIYISPMAIKNMLVNASRWLAMKIPGEGKKTYTKRFESGLMVVDRIELPAKEKDIKCETLFVPSDGKRGGSSRVMKHFPYIEIQNNPIEITIHVLDEKITQNVLNQHLVSAGQFVGLGRFRPENNGIYGRFKLENLDWQVVEE